MKRIKLSRYSFLAWVEYDEHTEELFIVVKKNGKRFRYENVPPEEFEAIKQATNMGNYISTVFLKKFKASDFEIIPLAIIEREIISRHNWNLFLAR